MALTVLEARQTALRRDCFLRRMIFQDRIKPAIGRDERGVVLQMPRDLAGMASDFDRNPVHRPRLGRAGNCR